MAPTSQQARMAKLKSMSTGKQPKARVVRYLKSKESQLVEGCKNVLLFKGIKCSEKMSLVLRDLRALKAPNAKMLSKNNELFPFDPDGTSSIEFLTTKNDCSLFTMASHNKKRPDNLILGRTFDHLILDMVELHVVKYKSLLLDYKGAPKKRVGSKPLMLFVGDGWHLDSTLTKLQNLFIDYFRGEPISKLTLSGIDHLISFTVGPPPPSSPPPPDGYDDAGYGGGGGTRMKKNYPIVHMRTYYVKLKKNPNGGKVPVPHLVNSGPDMDFKIRRTQYASSEMWKESMKQPRQNNKASKSSRKKKKKNQSTNVFGETIGRLHLTKQDLNHVGGKRSRAIRLAGKAEAEEEKAKVEGELAREADEMGKEFQQLHGFDEKELD